MDSNPTAAYEEMDAELAEATDWSDLDAFRAKRAQLEEERLKTQGPPEPGIREEIRTITMRDGFENKIKVHRPATAGGPLIVLVFGGGFVVGNEGQLTPLARALARTSGATAITIGYRLAPESKFPTAAHDVEDSLLWIAKNSKELEADPSKSFVLGGISAGGNLVACVAQKTLHDKSLAHPLTGLWLCVPWIFPLENDLVPAKYKDIYLSRDRMVAVPGLDRDSLTAIEDYLSPDACSPLYSPFNSKNPHVGMPQTYVQVCGLDPLRDDGVVYEKVLQENGVTTKIDVWPGVPHAHFAFFPFLATSKKAMVDVELAFGWLLGADLTAQRI
ncbi:lipase/esterase [Aureobasidium pullulans]|uniref:Lipase/esterase n=1 Tax=Aureobasidium pullulans TaxID=5580 RepID=A0A4S9KSG6_AURPU|nr:lipase/esterase [Aureobasidium pullulans]